MALSNQTKAVLLGPLNKNNPVIVQVLGICSALAVTSKLEPSLVMAVAVTLVLAAANVIISLLRKTIPNRIRIIVQLVVVAALVTIVSEVLKAFAYDEQAAFGVRGTDCDQLYPDGTSRKRSPWATAPGLLPRRHRQRTRLCWILVAVGLLPAAWLGELPDTR